MTMFTPDTLTYERWLDSFGAAAGSITPNSGVVIMVRIDGAASEHDYELDLSTGSYAVEAHVLSKQLTTERWLETISTGSRTTGSADAAEPVDFTLEEQLIGAL